MEGAHRIMGGDRLVDRGMIANRKAVGIRHVDGGGPLVDQPLDERIGTAAKIGLWVIRVNS